MVWLGGMVIGSMTLKYHLHQQHHKQNWRMKWTKQSLRYPWYQQQHLQNRTTRWIRQFMKKDQEYRKESNGM